MNRQDLQELQSIRTYPCVSILSPTHRTAPENRQDPIRIRNLVDDAVQRLREEFTARESAAVEAQITALVDGIDWAHTLDGIALYASADFGASYILPFSPRERVIIDETFATRDVVYALNRAQRYWVLVLSEKPTRLYEGFRDSVVEVRNRDFPVEHTGPGGSAPLPGGAGINVSAVRDEKHRQFFRDIDSALGAILLRDPLPVVVCGVDRYLSFFREISANDEHIKKTLTGSYDFLTEPQLASKVWPLMREWLNDTRMKAVDRLKQAVAAQKFASTINDVWQASLDGRVRSLVVEDNYSFAGVLDETGRKVTPVDDPTRPGVIDDVIDELIEEVIRMGGDINFVPDGSLEAHQRVGAILRY